MRKSYKIDKTFFSLRNNANETPDSFSVISIKQCQKMSIKLSNFITIKN